MTTPSRPTPWQAANVDPGDGGLAHYATQGEAEWKARILESATKSLLSLGMWALKVPLVDDLTEAITGVGEVDLNNDGIPDLQQVTEFLESKWDLVDNIGDAVELLTNAFIAVIKAAGGDYSDITKLPEQALEVVENMIRTLATAVFDPSWLANIVPGQVGSGWSDNLLTNPIFDGVVSLLSEAGWEHDGTVFPAGAKGSGKVVADGTRKTLSNKIVKGSPGQMLRAGGQVEWSGPAATVGRAFTVEVRPFTAAGVELPPVDVVGITSPAASSSGVFQTITADLPWPAGAAWVRTRIAVENTVPVGTVVRWSNLDTRKGGFMPQDRIKDLPDDLEDLVGRFLGIGNALNGFLRGQGTPTTGTPADPILDWVRDALGLFTGSTNATATTADEANGVGGNALANTVSIQAQVSGLVDRADAGWTARPLWASMDFTADATFAKNLMLSLQHSHSASASSSSNNATVTTAGETGNTTAGGDYHSHSVNISASPHSHGVTTTVSVNSAGPSLTPASVTSSQAFLGYIRCGSVQDKRLFTFLAQASGTVSTFNLDVYRMASDGGLTLAYSSASFAGAIGGSLGWVQHTIPSGTASVAVQPGDIIAVQLRMTGSGSVLLGGITTPLPLNPPGWLPLRESAVRNPSTPAPATIAAATANASHTSTAIPFIEAGIDTGLANAPITITDNFDGTLSTLWLMQGPNTLGITSNQLGIVDGNSDGYSWGTFRQRVSTDNMKVGFSVSSPTDREQIVWFHGRDRDNHVGLAITSTYATLYTMSSGSRTNRAQVAIGTVAASYEIRVSGTAYSVWRNGAQIGSWTDSGAVAPSGRAGGVGLQAVRTGWFGALWYGANPIDNWLLADV
ncbi:hypothetical protein [Tsukamurella sp. NPDC003166]|uniref:hypothetical protein n=1 Tax=Tsukamurella sp. NPDC003166 TaxID=3154444 RepID=UPI0033A25C3E